MNQWVLLGVTVSTKNYSQYSDVKFGYVFHVKNLTSNKHHKYYLNKVNKESINVRCHSFPKCKACLCIKLGKFVYKKTYIFLQK